MAVNSIIECFSRDLDTEYCQGLVSRAGYTAPPSCFETLPGRSNRSLPCLPFPMHAQEIISTFSVWNINIRLCLPKALTLKRLQWYKMIEVLPIVRNNQSLGHVGMLNFRLVGHAFPYRLARWIPLKKGVL